MANDAMRRIMAEIKEFAALNNQPQTFFHAAPLETDLFEWHFSVRGPPDTPFEQGVYHGRILLPAEYPLKAPEIILLTPNGRFEVGQRICLSVTSHHQETWQPSWGIRTILTALVGFMPSKAEGVGALDYPDDDRRGLARKSHFFKCERCGVSPIDQLPPREARNPPPSPPSEDSTGETVSHERPTSVDAQPSSQRHHPPEQLTASAESPTPMTVSADPCVSREAETPNRLPLQPRHEKPVTSSTPTSGTRAPDQAQEKELLYVAYAIIALMLAVILRRVFKMIAE